MDNSELSGKIADCAIFVEIYLAQLLPTGIFGLFTYCSLLLC